MSEKNGSGKFMDDEILSLSEIIVPIKKNWLAILLTTFAGGLLGAAYCYVVPPVYEAKAYMQIGIYSGGLIESIGKISTIMSAPENTSKVTSALLQSGMDDRHIGRAVGSVKFTEESDMLKISAQAGAPDKAVATIAAVIKILLERHDGLYAEAEDQIQKGIRVIRENIRPTPISAGIKELTITPSIVKVAPYADLEPIWPKKKFIISSSFMSGGILSILVALLIDKIKNSGNSPR